MSIWGSIKHAAHKAGKAVKHAADKVGKTAKEANDLGEPSPDPATTETAGTAGIMDNSGPGQDDSASTEEDG